SINNPMPNRHNDALFVLIKTLTKAEKRHFQLYAGKNKPNGEILFVQLFNALDKQKIYNEDQLFKKVPGIKKQQLSNIKAHLYKHLLTSLRLLYKQRDPIIELREQMDYARVLYDKGIYSQSLKILSKIKTQAKERQEIILCHEIIEFEKLIESRHITRSLENRAETLSAESYQISRQLFNISSLSAFALQMYGLYLKLGHARNEKDAAMLKDFFDRHLPVTGNENMGFYENIYLYQAYSWYYYTRQDFVMYYRYCQKWVDLFDTFPSQKQADASLYIKAMHNLLTALFYTSSQLRFTKELSTLEKFIKQGAKNFDENIHATAFVYLYTAKINRHFLEGTFKEGLKLVPVINRESEALKLKMDPHRIMVFDYKIACLYFGSGDNHHAIDYLNRIINLHVGSLRADIQCFARILHLIAHYELENYSLVEYLIKSVYHFIARNKDLGQVMEEIMKFLRKNLYANPKELHTAFIDLHDRLIDISQNPFEKRSFLYLDIISWLESKIEGKPVQAVIRKKYLNKVPRF
ncbi:MAG TPA: hypothetical protein VIU45_06250, partial [Chitinophagaceae bacterium]